MARQRRRPADAKRDSGDDAAATLTVEPIEVDANGYDGNGAYYGTGTPVFLVTWPDGASQALRAATLEAARRKAKAMLERSATEAAEDTRRRQVLEQKAAQTAPERAHRTTRYETTWRHPLTGATAKLAIKHTRDYLGSGEDHLEIESAKGVPHPLSETGYRSHFVKGLDIINAGGPVVLVDRLVAEALRDRQWLARESRRQQIDLFDWADARDAATRTAAADKPAAKSRRRARMPKP